MESEFFRQDCLYKKKLMISKLLLYSVDRICTALANCLCALVLLLKTVADQLKTLHSTSFQYLA